MIWDTPFDLLVAELVKVAVGPAKSGLQHAGKPVHAQVETDLQFAPDLRLHALEDNREIGNEVGCRVHATSLTATPGALQFQGSSSPRRLCGISAIRAIASAGQACGSMSLGCAETMRVYMKAAQPAPRSEPANSQAFLLRSRRRCYLPGAKPITRADWVSRHPRLTSVLPTRKVLSSARPCATVYERNVLQGNTPHTLRALRGG